MIIGVGTDIIDVKRIKYQIEKDPGIRQILFTDNEIAYSECKITWAQTYAGKFAAKEAFLKAIGTGLTTKMRYTDIEILNDELGKPFIQVSNCLKTVCDDLAIGSILVSISHIREIATAFVVVQSEKIGV